MPFTVICIVACALACNVDLTQPLARLLQNILAHCPQHDSSQSCFRQKLVDTAAQQHVNCTMDCPTNLAGREWGSWHLPAGLRQTIRTTTPGPRAKGTTETTIFMAPLPWSTPPELTAEPIIFAKGPAETTIFMDGPFCKNAWFRGQLGRS
jgi:hypothetical protein